MGVERCSRWVRIAKAVVVVVAGRRAYGIEGWEGVMERRKVRWGLDG